MKTTLLILAAMLLLQPGIGRAEFEEKHETGDTRSPCHLTSISGRITWT